MSEGSAESDEGIPVGAQEVLRRAGTNKAFAERSDKGEER